MKKSLQLDANEKALHDIKTPALRYIAEEVCKMADHILNSAGPKTSVKVTSKREHNLKRTSRTSGPPKVSVVIDENICLRIRTKHSNLIFNSGGRDDAPTLYDQKKKEKLYLPRVPTARDITRYLSDHIADDISRSYRDMKPSKRPRHTFIQLENDPYRFIPRLKHAIEFRADGLEIDVINEADLPPPMSFKDRLLSITKPKPAELPATKYTPPDYVLDLPAKFQKAVTLIKNPDLKTNAEAALAQITKSCDYIKDQYAAINDNTDNLEHIIEISALRPLKNYLATVHSGLPDFDFSQETPVQSRYLKSIEGTLRGLFETIAKNKIEDQLLGERVALQRLESRGLKPSVEQAIGTPEQLL